MHVVSTNTCKNDFEHKVNISVSQFICGMPFQHHTVFIRTVIIRKYFIQLFSWSMELILTCHRSGIRYVTNMLVISCNQSRHLQRGLNLASKGLASYKPGLVSLQKPSCDIWSDDAILNFWK